MPHIEDSRPKEILGTPESRVDYQRLRGALVKVSVELGQRALRWTLQPDWKILEAALAYEGDKMMESTDGLNVFEYLEQKTGTWIAPHSRENGGYNYTDVAYLIEALGGHTA